MLTLCFETLNREFLLHCTATSNLLLKIPDVPFVHSSSPTSRLHFLLPLPKYIIVYSSSIVESSTHLIDNLRSTLLTRFNSIPNPEHTTQTSTSPYIGYFLNPVAIPDSLIHDPSSITAQTQPQSSVAWKLKIGFSNVHRNLTGVSSRCPTCHLIQVVSNLAPLFI
jgi:hypothetical protein